MWARYSTSITVALSFLALFSGFWFFPSFTFIILISLMLNMLLAIPVRELRRRTKISFTLSAIIVLSIFVLIIGSLITVISSSLIPSLDRFINDLPQITGSIQALPLFSGINLPEGQTRSIWSDMAAVGMEALKSSMALLLSLFSKIIDIIIILFATFYLLEDGRQLKQHIAQLFPTADSIRVLHLFNNILKSLRIYISSQLIVCTLTGSIVFFYFYIRHLPYAPVFAVISAVSEFIPVIGPTVASIFGILMTATFSPLIAIHTAIFYLALTQINHNLIYPFIVGKGLNLHPLAIILGIIFGGEILGAPGMFLAVPCMSIIKYIIIDIQQDIKNKQ